MKKHMNQNMSIQLNGGVDNLYFLEDYLHSLMSLCKSIFITLLVLVSLSVNLIFFDIYSLYHWLLSLFSILLCYIQAIEVENYKTIMLKNNLL